MSHSESPTTPGKYSYTSEALQSSFNQIKTNTPFVTEEWGTTWTPFDGYPTGHITEYTTEHTTMTTEYTTQDTTDHTTEYTTEPLQSANQVCVFWTCVDSYSCYRIILCI